MLELVSKLAELGYGGVELELDRNRMHPHVHTAESLQAIGGACRDAGLRTVLGTGGRHVLTERRHYPGAVTVEDDARRQWVSFIRDSLDLAARLGAECVMVHSGYAPAGASEAQAWDLLVDSMGSLARHASAIGQRLAVEWHPEMFLATADQYLKLADAVDSQALKCTLDVGHAHCTEDEPVQHVIERLADHTIHVQLEDMKNRVHEHLPLGRGELDFREIFAAFDRTKFAGVVALEFNAGDLGGNGDELAEQSIRYLRELLP